MAAPHTTIRKNSKEELRIGIERFKDKDIFNVRVWFKGNDDEMRPGKAGVAFRATLLPDFANAVNAALAEARKRGLAQ